MIYRKLVSRRTYFFNNCGIISACVVCAALSAVVVMGLRIYVTQFPRFLGNAPENIAYIKTTTDPNEFTFIVVGDVKSGTATFEAMLDVIHQDKPAFAVILGDFVDHTELISHKLFALEIEEYAHDFPIFIIPGNHDISEEGQFRLKDFQNTYGPAQFCFTIFRRYFSLWTGKLPKILREGYFEPARKDKKDLCLYAYSTLRIEPVLDMQRPARE